MSHLDNPQAIVPVQTEVSAMGNAFDTQIEPKTFAIYKFVKTTK